MVGQHHGLNVHEFEQTQETVKTEEPGMLQAMGSQRVRYNLGTVMNSPYNLGTT